MHGRSRHFREKHVKIRVTDFPHLWYANWDTPHDQVELLYICTTSKRVGLTQRSYVQVYKATSVRTNGSATSQQWTGGRVYGSTKPLRRLWAK